jgi:deoxyhypusine synthase
MTQLGPFIRETGGNLTGAVTMTTGTQAMIGADGGYTPATLPAASLFAAVQYCTGMGGAGGASGAVYSDGTNWRKISNDMIVI